MCHGGPAALSSGRHRSSWFNSRILTWPRSKYFCLPTITYCNIRPSACQENEGLIYIPKLSPLLNYMGHRCSGGYIERLTLPRHLQPLEENTGLTYSRTPSPKVSMSANRLVEKKKARDVKYQQPFRKTRMSSPKDLKPSYSYINSSIYKYQTK